MPVSSPDDIASFAIANTASLAATNANQTAAIDQSEADIRTLNERLRVAEDAKGKLDEATRRLDQSERELAALKLQTAADSDAAAIMAYLYPHAAADGTQWAAKLKQVRAAMEKSDTDNDAMHTTLFFDGPESDYQRFMLKMVQGDDEIDQAVARDFQSFADNLKLVSQQLEKRNAAVRDGQYVPASTFTLEVALSALGEPASASDVPYSSPSRKTARKAARSPNRTRN